MMFEKLFAHLLRVKKKFDNILAMVNLGLNALLQHQYKKKKKVINKNNQTIVNLLTSNKYQFSSLSDL